jgi:TolB-like protein/tetratricopeptide (TPR) repeat protein
MPDPPRYQRLKERKLVQWALAYLAGAFVVFQLLDALETPLGLTATIQQGILAIVVIGFVLTLVLAWFHGEKGRQRVSLPELLTISALLIGCGITVWLVGPFRETSQPTGAMGETGDLIATVPLRAVLYENPSVALLPLRNLGGPEDEPFVEGLHDDILGSLQQIGGLTVISSTSVRRYRGRDVLLPEIARELRVDAVGEGTVSRGGDRIRVNVQLIDGASDAHLWSEQFDRELSVTDVFAIRTEIARAVARAMRATLTSREEARLATTPPASLTAYDWVQIARSRCDGCEDRGEAYRRALEADSTYAVAWAGLAGNYAVRVLAFGAQTALADSALAFADRALELDPELASAHSSKGTASYAARGQSGQALEHARRAAQLEPGNAARWTNVGVFSAMRGRWVEALDAYWRSLRLRPTSAFVRGNMAELYAALGLHERAAETLAEASQIGPSSETVLHYGSYAAALAGDLVGAWELATRTVELYPQARNHQWAALLAGRMGRIDEALAHAEAAQAEAPEGLSMESNVRAVPVTLGFALLSTGDTAASERLFWKAAELLRDRLEGGADDGYTRVELAAIAAARGDAGEASRWMESAFEAGFRYYREIELDPIFDAVREAPRFRRAMNRIRADVEEMRGHVLDQEADVVRAWAGR